MTTWKKPDPSTLSPYKRSYIDRVPDGDLPTILEKNLQETISFLRKLPADKLKYRYAEGKWSIPQIVQHISDCERIFGYRILCIARGDKTPLPGFEENDYARESGADEKNFQDILHEFLTVRNATLSLYKTLNDSTLDRKGTSNNLPVVVRELVYMVAGHELHHMAIIKDRYLK